MRALTGIAIVTFAAALAACGNSETGAGGAGGGAGGTDPTTTTTGNGGDDSSVTGTGGAGGEGVGGEGGTPIVDACADFPEAPFDCGDADVCLSLNAICDGEIDCETNDADEADCVFECGADEYQCPGDGECFPFSFLCDGEADCSQGEDEDFTICDPGCSDDQAICADGSCIEGSDVCDGIADCSEDEDEDPELCGEESGICDSGIQNTDPNVTFCLSVNCCFEFNECTADGTDVDGCISCLEGDGEEFCYAALSCAAVYCGQ